MRLQRRFPQKATIVFILLLLVMTILFIVTEIMIRKQSIYYNLTPLFYLVLTILFGLWLSSVSVFEKIHILGDRGLLKRTPHFNGDVVLVVGNGFDIDLGLKTKYSDFCNSTYWPFTGSGYGKLGQYLNECKIDGWYGLEAIIGKYGSTQSLSSDQLNDDMRDYQALVSSLTSYIKNVCRNYSGHDCFAKDVFTSIVDSRKHNVIFSFKYTDVWTMIPENDNTLHKLVNLMENIIHVHGSEQTNDVILGVGDYERLTEGREFLYKSSNPKYQSSGITEKLQNAEAVIFFGHSLSRVDYTYFEYFFKQIANHESNCRFVYIYTYDDKSVMSIKNTLREMCSSNLANVFGNTHIKFITTVNRSQESIDAHRECLDTLFHNRKIRWEEKKNKFFPLVN